MADPKISGIQLEIGTWAGTLAMLIRNGLHFGSYINIGSADGYFGLAFWRAGLFRDVSVINIDANPGPSGNLLAASDIGVYRTNAGLFILDTVSSISSLAVTLTTNLAAAISKGADLWMYGVLADTDPNSGEAHQTFIGTASVITTIKDDTAGLVASFGLDEPLVVQSNNATATGFLEQVGYVHTRR